MLPPRRFISKALFFIQGSFVSCRHETDGHAVAKAKAAMNDREQPRKIFFRSSAQCTDR